MAKPRNNGPVTHSAMSQRLLDLTAETRTPEPYPVTDTLVVTPPTRTRRRAMYEADVKMFMTRQMLAQAIAAAAEPAPEPPTPAAAPQDVDDQFDDEAAAQAAEAAHAKTAEVLREQHAAAHAAWLTRTADARSRVDAINGQVRDATEDYDRAFFGDAYDAVVEFFEDKPLMWERFIPDIKSEFLPAAPDDGTCATCGQIVDEEQAKKAPASST